MNVLVKWSVFVRIAHVVTLFHVCFFSQPAQPHVRLLCVVVWGRGVMDFYFPIPPPPYSDQCPSPLTCLSPPVLLQLKQVYQYYSALGTSETDDIFTISLEQVRCTYSPLPWSLLYSLRPWSPVRMDAHA